MPNPNEGGDLFDMAKDGTKMPRNAGKPRAIPSVPGSADTDAPALDTQSSEVTTATGDVLSESVTQKQSGNGGKEDDYQPTPHGGRNHPA